jgi:hypothetical protein
MCVQMMSQGRAPLAVKIAAAPGWNAYGHVEEIGEDALEDGLLKI